MAFDFDKAVSSATAQPNTKTFDMNKALGIEPEGGFIPAVKNVTGQTIKGGGQLATDYIPGVSADNAVTQYGQEMVDANPLAVQGLRDIVDKPGKAVTEALGNAAPMGAGMLGLRALGQAITTASPAAGVAAPIVAGAGQAISWGGPWLLASLASYSGTREEQKSDTAGSKALAAAGSLASGGIEMLGGPESRILKNFATKAGEQVATTGLKKLGKEVLKSGLEEAGEEMLQNPIEQLASYKDPTTAQSIHDTLFGGAMGFIGGGILGGGAQVAFGKDAPAQPKTKEEEITSTVQTEALSNMVGRPTQVDGNRAYIDIGNNEMLTAPLEAVTDHFAKGGKLEDFDTAVATKDSLDVLSKSSVEFLTNLRNDNVALIGAGVNRKDIDALILSKVEDTPGRREYIANLLSSGMPDPTSVKAISSGVNLDLNDPVQADFAWMDQTSKAAARNAAANQAKEQSNARFLDGVNNAVDSQVRKLAQWETMDAARKKLATTNAAIDAALSEYFPEPPPSRLVGEFSPTGEGLRVTADSSVLGAVPKTDAELRAERLGLYRDLFSNTSMSEQDIRSTMSGFESIRADAVREVTSLMANGAMTPAQARVEIAEVYKELFKNTDLSPREIAENIQRLEANHRAAISQESTMVGTRPSDPNLIFEQDRANRAAMYRGLFGPESATPAVAPLPGELPPSAPASTSTAAGVAPSTQEALNAQETRTQAQAGSEQEGTARPEGGSVRLRNNDQPGVATEGGTQERQQILKSQTAQQQGVTPEAVHAEVRTFLGPKGHNNLTRTGKLEVVQTAAEVPVGSTPIRDENNELAGAYDTRSGKIYLVASNLSAGQGEYVFRHEAAHALLREDKQFIRQRDAILRSFESLSRRDASVQSAMARVPEGTDAGVRTEEALAYWLQEKANHSHSLFKRIIAAVKAALRRIGIPVGKYSQTELARMFTLGTVQWAENAQAMPSNDQTKLLSKVLFKPVDVNSANFRRWFAGSKVVDDKGKPLVMYHGTTKVFDSFVPGGKRNEQLGFGIHLTTDPSFADEYASNKDVRRKGKNPNIVAAFVAAKNPLLADVIAREGTPEYDLAVALAGKRSPVLFQNEYTNNGERTGKKIVYLRSAIDAAPNTTAEKLIRSAGYDAVIYKAKLTSSPMPGGYGYADPKEAQSIVVFSPTQIKSAISNTGEFSQSDARILFSVAASSTQAASQSIYDKLKQYAKTKQVDLAPRYLAVAPLHTLVQTIGKQIPQVREFARHLDEAEHIATSITNDAFEKYKQIQDFGQKTVDAVNRAAATASFYRMHPDLNLDEQEWVSDKAVTRDDKLISAEAKWKASGMDKSTGISFIKAWKEARDAFQAIPSEEARELYLNMVAYMGTIREREKNNLQAYIERSTEGNAELRDQMMQRFNATFNNIAGAYWPLNRVGDYTLDYIDLNGVRNNKRYDTAEALRADKEMLVKDGVDPTTILEGYADKRPRGQVAIPSELIQQLSAAVYSKEIAKANPEDPQAVEAAKAKSQEVVDEMNQIWLRWQPETSSLKNAVQRKNVKGFDENMMQAFLDYNLKHASNIAWSEQGRKIEDTLSSLSDQVREDRQNQAPDVIFKGTVLVDLRNRLQAIRDAKAGPVASTIGKLGTAYYMTSPSIALVQLTQLPTLTLPKLAVKYGGVGKASKALMQGLQQSFSKKFSQAEMFGDTSVNMLHDQLREVVTQDHRDSSDQELQARIKDKALGDRVYDDAYIEAKYKSLTPYQQQLFVLRESLARNLLDISAAHEAYALAQGKNPNNIVSRVFNLAMMPMKYSEMASRKAAILATMDLAKGKSFKSTMNNVAEVVNDTLYSYSKANKPAVLQGGTARVLMMFQWYRIMTGLRIGLLAKRMFAAETPEIKSAARKEFIGIMGMTGMLAGAVGMPMAKMIFATLDALADDDEPRDSELEFKNWAAEKLGPYWGDVLTYGLGGAGLSKRVGMGDLYGSATEAPPRLHGRELAMWQAANQLGPAFGIYQSWVQGLSYMLDGEYSKGLEAAMPKGVKDGLKAARSAQDGAVKTLTGRVLLPEDQMDAGTIPLMALGLTPSDVAKANKDFGARERISAAISERRGKIVKDMVKAIQGEGDIFEARTALISYNKRMPRFAVTGGDINTALAKSVRRDRGVLSRREQLIDLEYGL